MCLGCLDEIPNSASAVSDGNEEGQKLGEYPGFGVLLFRVLRVQRISTRTKGPWGRGKVLPVVKEFKLFDKSA